MPDTYQSMYKLFWPWLAAKSSQSNADVRPSRKPPKKTAEVRPRCKFWSFLFGDRSSEERNPVGGKANKASNARKANASESKADDFAVWVSLKFLKEGKAKKGKSSEDSLVTPWKSVLAETLRIKSKKYIVFVDLTTLTPDVFALDEKRTWKFIMQHMFTKRNLPEKLYVPKKWPFNSANFRRFAVCCGLVEGPHPASVRLDAALKVKRQVKGVLKNSYWGSDARLSSPRGSASVDKPLEQNENPLLNKFLTTRQSHSLPGLNEKQQQQQQQQHRTEDPGTLRIRAEKCDRAVATSSGYRIIESDLTRESNEATQKRQTDGSGPSWEVPLVVQEDSQTKVLYINRHTRKEQSSQYVRQSSNENIDVDKKRSQENRPFESGDGPPIYCLIHDDQDDFPIRGNIPVIPIDKHIESQKDQSKEIYYKIKRTSGSERDFALKILKDTKSGKRISLNRDGDSESEKTLKTGRFIEKNVKMTKNSNEIEEKDIKKKPTAKILLEKGSSAGSLTLTLKKMKKKRSARPRKPKNWSSDKGIEKENLMNVIAIRGDRQAVVLLNGLDGIRVDSPEVEQFKTVDGDGWECTVMEIVEGFSKEYCLFMNIDTYYPEVVDFHSDMSVTSKGLIASCGAFFKKHGLPKELHSFKRKPFKNPEFENYLHSLNVSLFIESPILPYLNKTNQMFNMIKCILLTSRNYTREVEYFQNFMREEIKMKDEWSKISEAVEAIDSIQFQEPLWISGRKTEANNESAGEKWRDVLTKQLHSRNGYFLLFVDVESRILDVGPSNPLSRKFMAHELITACMDMFTKHGVPKSLRTSRSKPFVSKEFQKFSEMFKFSLRPVVNVIREDSKLYRVYSTLKDIFASSDDAESGMALWKSLQERFQKDTELQMFLHYRREAGADGTENPATPTQSETESDETSKCEDTKQVKMKKLLTKDRVGVQLSVEEKLSNALVSIGEGEGRHPTDHNNFHPNQNQMQLFDKEVEYSQDQCKKPTNRIYNRKTGGSIHNRSHRLIKRKVHMRGKVPPVCLRNITRILQETYAQDVFRSLKDGTLLQDVDGVKSDNPVTQDVISHQIGVCAINNESPFDQQLPNDIRDTTLPQKQDTPNKEIDVDQFEGENCIVDNDETIKNDSVENAIPQIDIGVLIQNHLGVRTRKKFHPSLQVIPEALNENTLEDGSPKLAISPEDEDSRNILDALVPIQESQCPITLGECDDSCDNECEYGEAVEQNKKVRHVTFNEENDESQYDVDDGDKERKYYRSNWDRFQKNVIRYKEFEMEMEALWLERCLKDRSKREVRVSVPFEQGETSSSSQDRFEKRKSKDKRHRPKANEKPLITVDECSSDESLHYAKSGRNNKKDGNGGVFSPKRHQNRYPSHASRGKRSQRSYEELNIRNGASSLDNLIETPDSDGTSSTRLFRTSKDGRLAKEIQKEMGSVPFNLKAYFKRPQLRLWEEIVLDVCLWRENRSSGQRTHGYIVCIDYCSLYPEVYRLASISSKSNSCSRRSKGFPQELLSVLTDLGRPRIVRTLDRGGSAELRSPLQSAGPAIAAKSGAIWKRLSRRDSLARALLDRVCDLLRAGRHRHLDRLQLALRNLRRETKKNIWRDNT